MYTLSVVIAAVIFMFAASDAQAYIGPGLGAGTLGIILGFIVSVVLAVFAIFWYPIKRLWKKISKKAE